MTQGSHSDLIIFEKLSYVCTEYIIRELTSGLCKRETLEATQMHTNEMYKLEYYTAIKIG